MHTLHNLDVSLKPTLPDLKAFVTVAELQSFAAAAKALHLSQPALSRRIAHLESVLEVRLFDRTTRSVELTQLGQRFFGEVRKLLHELDRSVHGLHDAAQLETGDITVGCVFSAVHHFLPEVIRTFRARHPQVMVRIIEEGADEVLASVKSGEADFALNYIGMHDPEVEFTPLLKESFVLACPAGHALAQRSSVSWSEMTEHECVMLAQGSGNRMLIDQALATRQTATASRAWTCEVRHVPALISLIEAGIGIGAVPRFSVPTSGSKGLVTVALVEPKVTCMIGIIRRRGRPLTPAAEAFRNLLTSHKT